MSIQSGWLSRNSAKCSHFVEGTVQKRAWTLTLACQTRKREHSLKDIIACCPKFSHTVAKQCKPQSLWLLTGTLQRFWLANLSENKVEQGQAVEQELQVPGIMTTHLKTNSWYECVPQPPLGGGHPLPSQQMVYMTVQYPNMQRSA